MTATANQKMTGLARINRRRYGRLLAKTLPTVIRTEEENERIFSGVKKLLKKGDRLTPEENNLLDLLSLIIEKFEEEHYTIPGAPVHAVIQMLMKDRNLRQRDLMPALGSSGVTSDVITGKRKPSKTQIK
ncbi:MAG: helix-turn-helix domain-containing protein, partial [Pyrinomonadaceae bacterium]